MDCAENACPRPIRMKKFPRSYYNARSIAKIDEERNLDDMILIITIMQNELTRLRNGGDLYIREANSDKMMSDRLIKG